MVYRCQGMADNCGMCLELADKYQCGWCNDQCDVEEECIQRNRKISNPWLNKHQTCPDPQILDFDPKSGPLEGGTNITIKGINLGRNFEDIMHGVHVAHEQNGVTIGLINCIPFRDLYIKTVQITCQVQESNISNGHGSLIKTISGPVVVKVLGDYTAKSRDRFSFVSPTMISFEPTKGPKAGGTMLKIWGLHMNAGSKVEVFVGRQSCQVIYRDANRVECITSKRAEAGEDKVRIKFDNGWRTIDKQKFIHVENPKIFSVESGSTGQKGFPKGIPSGGIKVIVEGSNLNSIEKPLMYVEVDGIRYNRSCSIESSKQLKCKTPAVPIEKLRFQEGIDYIELDYGFIMDNVISVQDLTKRKENPFLRFRMFQNPEYHTFLKPSGIKYYKSDYLTINVSHL